MLTFTDIAVRRGPRELFRDVSMTVYPGQKLGLTGANGSGKSSLLALVLGHIDADRGDVSVPAGITIAHVAQETPAVDTSALDYVIEGDSRLSAARRELAGAEGRGDGHRIAELHQQLDALGGYDADARAARLMRGLGFEPGQETTPVRDLSGGWRMRLNLAQALMCRSDLMLLDEPTNHLDLDAVIWLERWLRRYPGTLVLISHDRDFLDAVTTHTAHIEAGTVRLYTGNYTEFEAQRAARMAVEAAARVKQQRQARHMQAFVDRFRYKASKARQAQSRLKALERMAELQPAHADSPFDFSFDVPAKTPRPLLTLDRAAAGYGDTTVLSGVRLELAPGDRIGLLGPNGAGKSTLVRLIAGQLETQSGHRIPANDLEVGYFAQHQLEQLDAAGTPMSHLAAIDDPSVREQDRRNFLGRFGFVGDRAFDPCGRFSGGEQARLVLALVVRRAPNLLLLDEPTNHLDLEMRHALTLALQSFPGAVILVSHDRHLLRAACDQMLLVAGGDVRPFDGDLEDYARWLAGKSDGSDAPPAKPAVSTADERRQQRRDEARQRQKLAPVKARMARIEREMDKLAERRDAVTERLNDQALYADSARDELQGLLHEQAQIARSMQDLETEWMAASETLETLAAGD